MTGFEAFEKSIESNKSFNTDEFSATSPGMQICLATLNSTYQHAAFGLRYLMANLGELKSQAKLMEFTIHKDPTLIAQEILSHNPRIVGLGVYIWNTTQTLPVVEKIKELSPETIVVLGGPEVSYESEGQVICQKADYVIKGEADFLFREFCEQILLRQEKPAQKFIAGALPDISQIASPYSQYTDHDIEKRVVYVEASRGCPYKCEYCLSSLDKSVRNFPLDQFLKDLEVLIDRGTRQFKFIDRTFNLSPSISTRILNFFLERIDRGLFLHFEMVPDRLPQELRDLIQKFPAGSLQFEIGIQTWNPIVAGNVSRKNDLNKVRENLHFLRHETKVHTHVDLIAGLPGENLESFAQGFDAVAQLEADEIQLGILKRLKGTPIIRHEKSFQMRYQSEAPFQIQETKDMSAEVLAKFQRMSRYWDMIANSGNFVTTATQIRELLQRQNRSLFYWYWGLTDFLHERIQKTHSIPLLNLFQALHDYLIDVENLEEISVKTWLHTDYKSGARLDTPQFLKVDGVGSKTMLDLSHLPKRQRQHLQNTAE